ncbi:MAG TPA: autotransporter-associated beta strand repeat-containing protein, partial [Chthoniobacterales bacterium]
IDHAGAGTNTLTTNTASATTFAGTIRNTAGTLKLVKNGSGTLILSGNNTYTGETDINAGTLTANTNSALGAASAPVYIGNGSSATAGTPAILAIAAGVTLQNTTIVTNPDFNGSNALRTITGNGGTSTYTGNVYIGGGAVLSAASGNTTNFTGVIQNSTDNGTGVNRDLTKNGAGIVTLSGNNIYTGSTIVNGGFLNAAANGALGSGTTGTSGIAVNSGTLVLTNSAATDRVKDTAPITLAGGTLARSGFGTVSEGTGASRNGSTFTGTNTVGLGALTLTAASTLDYNPTISVFPTGGVGTFVFSSFTPNGNLLTINNYYSSANAGSNLSGVDGIDDRLIFNSDQSSNLAFFSFGGTVGAAEIALGGGFFEVVPVPEPSTWAAGILALTALCYSKRRYFRVTRTIS